MMRANLLILSAATVLAACSQSDSAPADETTQSTSGPAPVVSEEAVPPGQAAEAAADQPADDVAVAPGEPVEALVWGNWTVTSARLSNPNGPVQAFSTGQLSELRGSRLTIARDEAGWTGPATFDDTAFASACSKPQPEAVGADGVVLRCAGGNVFGPDSGSTGWRMIGNDRMVVPWFDGVTLDLVRTP